MAIVSHCTLGIVHGKIGNITFRRRKGNLCAYALPQSYTTPMDAHSISLRNKFAFNGQLAKTITSIPSLKAIWRSYHPKGHSAYNILLSANAGLVTEDSITDGTLLTPSLGIPASISSLEVRSDTIIIGIEVIPPYTQDYFHNYTLNGVCIISASSPKDGTTDHFYLCAASSNTSIWEADHLTCSFALSNRLKEHLLLYNKIRILLCAIFTEKDSQNLLYTTTCRTTLQFDNGK